MSHRRWHCRNAACPTPHGAVLGRVTDDDALVVDPAAAGGRVYLDTRRARVVCPACGAEREFHGTAVFFGRP